MAEACRRSKAWKMQVIACRIVALGLSICVLIFRRHVDGVLENIWRHARQHDVFQLESFEPFLSVASFAVFIGLWGILDFMVPAASTVHKDYRIAPSDDLSAWFGGTRWRDQILWYVVPLAIFDLLFPRRRLPEAAPSFARLVAEVVGAIAVYDVAFFAWHATLHSNRCLYSSVHAKHHRCRIQRAPESVQHTFVDGSVDVACSILALNVLRCHPLSRAVYDVVIIYLITELHAGYDFPWQLHNMVPFGLLGGPPRHDRHHREGTVYMQKFGTYLDAVFGFVPTKQSTGRDLQLATG